MRSRRCAKRRTSSTLIGCNAPPLSHRPLCLVAHHAALKLLSPATLTSMVSHPLLCDHSLAGLGYPGHRWSAPSRRWLLFHFSRSSSEIHFQILSAASQSVSYARWCGAALSYHGSSSPWWSLKRSVHSIAVRVLTAALRPSADGFLIAEQQVTWSHLLVLMDSIESCSRCPLVSGGSATHLYHCVWWCFFTH